VLQILLVIRCPVVSLAPQISISYLDESNIGSLLSEALTADVEAVLADETGLVGADAAKKLVLADMFIPRCLLLHPALLPSFPQAYRVEFRDSGLRTTRASPFRRSLGGSSRQSRET
jgi:hypothetical protein